MIQAMKHLFYLFFFVTDSSRQLKMSYNCKRFAVNLPGHSKTDYSRAAIPPSAISSCHPGTEQLTNKSFAVIRLKIQVT